MNKMPSKYLKQAMKAFRAQSRCHRRKDRNGKQILMKMSFDEWCNVWISSGHWEHRGAKNKLPDGTWFVMSRHNDLGHYELGNVEIITFQENVRLAQLSNTNIRGKTTSKRRRCSIGGPVFACVGDLIKAHGQGKSGYKHPSFRYL